MQEFHYIIKASSVEELVEKQKQLLENAADGRKAVFRKYFLKDAASQHPALPDEQGAVSYVQQPPLGGTAVAVWIYAVSGAEVEYGPSRTIVRGDGVEHIWTAGIVSPEGGSEEQSAGILESYGKDLCAVGLSIADNCVRTWFYVDDIDNNYAGMVKARRENFERCGLLPTTHYIASTGIAGKPAADGAIVQMDAYSVRGLENCRQRYLYAPTHLNPTYEYGVTFERGVRVEYSGKSHILISGTASIDNRGEILHVGDVAAQTLRMWENIEKLLEEGGSGWNDVRQIAVYLRNASDYATVAPMFETMFPDIPYVIVHAPVCRPGWLIEMECIAIF